MHNLDENFIRDGGADGGWGKHKPCSRPLETLYVYTYEIAMSGPAERECRWVGSSLKDLKAMPGVVIDEIGFALHQIQMGTTPGNVKALRGYGGAGVLEVLESHNGNAYRAVYTVKFEGVIYVLHVFQKKSRAGKKTPRQEMDKVTVRLRAAEADYAKRPRSTLSRTGRDA